MEYMMKAPKVATDVCENCGKTWKQVNKINSDIVYEFSTY
jgi:hypothetical protein